MKYKNIKSMLHNFGHSFCSLMNYVDGEYIIDILPDVIRKADGHEIHILFPSGDIVPAVSCPKKLRKSIYYYVDWLPKHAASHELALVRISDIQLTVTGTHVGIRYSVQAKDDRGVEYDICIQNIT